MTAGARGCSPLLHRLLQLFFLALKPVLFSPQSAACLLISQNNRPSCQPPMAWSFETRLLLTVENRLSPSASLGRMGNPWFSGRALSLPGWGQSFAHDFILGMTQRWVGDWVWGAEVWSGNAALEISRGWGRTSENNTEYRKVSLLVDAFISRLHWIDVIHSVGEFNFTSTPYYHYIKASGFRISFLRKKLGTSGQWQKTPRSQMLGAQVRSLAGRDPHAAAKDSPATTKRSCMPQ